MIASKHFGQIATLITLVTMASVVPTCSVLAAEPADQLSAFDGGRAYGYLRQICQLGPRFSGSPGMRKQQNKLEEYFVGLGAMVDYQRFQVKHPLSGKRVAMANLVVQWHPKSMRRILLCAHYDTRPLPDRDPNPRLRQFGEFLGANDGASGVALLMELGQHLPKLATPYGIDFVFFDGEELVYVENRDKYFLGSEWFARRYRGDPPKYQYECGVLLDMVGDANLTIYQERNSMSWQDTRPLVEEIWSTAERLGVKEFIPRIGYEVRDDHLPLHQIAKIPVCDVIDFRYPNRSMSFWHTTQDSPGRCSADSLGKVGLVILEWLRTKE